MARATPTELGVVGVVGILREVLAIPLRNPGLMASVLLLLLPCNVLLTVPKLSPRLSVDVAPVLNRLPLLHPPGPSLGESSGAAEPGGPLAGVPRLAKLPVDVVAPIDYVVTELSTLAMVYLSAVACKRKHPTLGALVSKIRRSWKKVVVSSLYLQLLHVAYSCLFLILGALMFIFKRPSWVLPLVVPALVYMFCFVVVLPLYLDIACRLSLLISAVEEDKGGVAAMARAVSLARERKLQGLVLTAVFLALNQFKQTGHAKIVGEMQTGIASLAVMRRFAHVLVDLSARLLGWLLWTVYYYECRKSRGLVGKEERVDEGQSLIYPHVL